MPTNFWSFIFIGVKDSWSKVGTDISTSFEITGLESWRLEIFLYFLNFWEEFDIREDFITLYCIMGSYKVTFHTLLLLPMLGK